jgi:hypothetical protein
MWCRSEAAGSLESTFDEHRYFFSVDRDLCRNFVGDGPLYTEEQRDTFVIVRSARNAECVCTAITSKKTTMDVGPLNGLSESCFIHSRYPFNIVLAVRFGNC